MVVQLFLNFHETIWLPFNIMDDKLPLQSSVFDICIERFHGKRRNFTCENSKLMQKFCTNSKEKIVTLDIIL